jgi:CRISPR/Cas system-associated protein Cas10 (large subunit of type III CRISPR-Cas system)
MGYATSNHRTLDDKESHCAVCGTTLNRTHERRREDVCLICRAAILHRVFAARRQVMNSIRARR